MKRFGLRLLKLWLSGLPGSFAWLGFGLFFLSIGESREILPIGAQYAIVVACCLILGPFVMHDSRLQTELTEELKKRAKQVEDKIDVVGETADPLWNDHLINRVHRLLRTGESTRAVAAYHDGAHVTWDEADRQLRKWQNSGMAEEKLDLLGRTIASAHAGSP